MRMMNMSASHIHAVMPGLVPGIHVCLATCQGVDGRDKPGHDEVGRCER
jgi:hypothetical protein